VKHSNDHPAPLVISREFFITGGTGYLGQRRVRTLVWEGSENKLTAGRFNRG
jgi:hypothetical protein